MAREQIDCLTGLRGIAAVYVVVFHYSSGPQSRMSNPALTFLFHGYLAVDFFFILSGFVMALNYGYMFRPGMFRAPYLDFLGRRIARVYPLYLVATLCACLLVLAGWLEGPDSRPLAANLFANLLMFQAWGFGASLDRPGWSISTEWAAYLAFPWLLIPTLFRGRTAARISLVVAVVVLFFICTLPSALLHRVHPQAILDISYYAHGIPLLRCISEFSLGILAYRFASTVRGRSFGAKPWPVVALCALALLLLAVPRTDLLLVMVMPALLVALTTGEHFPQRFLSSPPLMLAGTLSYSIYLVHILLDGLLSWIHSQANRHGLAHGQTYGAAVCIVLTLPLSWIAYTLIEAPGRQWLRRRFERGAHRRTERVISLETGVP